MDNTKPHRRCEHCGAWVEAVSYMWTPCECGAKSAPCVWAAYGLKRVGNEPNV